MSALHVAPKVGQLRRVLHHRQDRELRRLTPSDCEAGTIGSADPG